MHVALAVTQHRYGEFDGNALAIRRHRRDGQKLAGSIATLASLECAGPTLPMSGTQVLRNDEIEGLTNGLLGRESEDANGARVPDLDDTGAIGRENCV